MVNFSLVRQAEISAQFLEQIFINVVCNYTWRKFQPGWKTSSNQKEISARAEKPGRKVHLGMCDDLFSMKQDGGVACQPRLKLVGNRNKIPAHLPGWNFSLGWNWSCNRPLTPMLYFITKKPLGSAIKFYCTQFPYIFVLVSCTFDYAWQEKNPCWSKFEWNELPAGLIMNQQDWHFK